jgi:hypothetical protein
VSKDPQASREIGQAVKGMQASVVVLPHLKDSLKVVCDHSGALQLSHWLALQHRTQVNAAAAEAAAGAGAPFRHLVD